MRYMTAIPAYGRDYRSAAQVKADWEAGNDFLLQDLFSSGYINKDDKPANVVLNIRYANLTKVTVIR